jgi:hypothetical protein
MYVTGRVTQLMEHLDVFISVKPKPKQPSKVSLSNIVFITKFFFVAALQSCLHIRLVI